MNTDADLPTLVQRKDHINVLRYIRIHQLREPNLVLSHGKALLGEDFSRSLSDGLARLAALEQICLAALDVQDHDNAQTCLARLKESGISTDAVRFRRLLARCLESAGDYNGAEIIYDDLLKENPANLVARKRKYCILRSQVGRESEAMEALNACLDQDYGDTAAWYELAGYRRELGDYKGAAYALEEVILGGAASDSKIHCELAECYATIGGLENLMLSRKHMAQALELDPDNRRAMFGLAVAANAYLEEASAGAKKDWDDHEVAVAEELVKYGAEQVLKKYKGSDMHSAIRILMKEYTV